MMAEHPEHSEPRRQPPDDGKEDIDGASESALVDRVQEWITRRRATGSSVAMRNGDDLADLLPTLELLEDAVDRFESGNYDEHDIPERRLGHFRIERELGRGAMGVVYQAWDESLGRRVALKILPPGQLLDHRQVERFQRESQAAARLSHPHIVPVHGVGSTADTHYFAMQYIEGTSLAGYDFDRHERASDSSSAQRQERWRQIARIGRDVADALSYAHTEGVLHRDIKPTNLLIDPNGVVWVTDFGLASAEGTDELTEPGAIVGTLRYVAPEGLRGWSDPRSDIYGLAITLYELATGTPAFDSRHRAELMRQIANEDPTPPRRLRPDIPIDLETIILTGIDKNPERRYQTAAGMAADLDRYLEQRPIVARRSTLWHRVLLFSSRHRRGVLAAALVLAVVSALIAGWIMQLSSALHETERERARVKRALEVTESERRYALDNFDLSLSAVDSLLENVASDQLRRQPGFARLRTEILNEAVAFYERLNARREADSTVRVSTAWALLKLAQLRRSLDQFVAAESNLNEALRITDSLTVVRSDGDAAVLEPSVGWIVASERDTLRSMIHSELGYLAYRDRLGDPERAEWHLREAVRWSATSYESKGTLRSRRILRSLVDLSKHLQQELSDEAMPTIDRSIELAKQCLETEPGDSWIIRQLGVSYRSKAALYRRAGDYARAMAVLEESRRILETLRDRENVQPEDLASLAKTRCREAHLHRVGGRRTLERKALEAAVALLEDACNIEPAMLYYRAERADTLTKLASVVKAIESAESSEKMLADAVAELSFVVERSSDPSWQRSLCEALNTYGNALRRLRHPNRAEAQFRRAIALYEDLLAHHEPVDDWIINFSITVSNLGIVLDEVDPDEAERQHRRAVQLIDDLIQRSPRTGYPRILMGRLQELAICLWPHKRIESIVVFERAIAIGRRERIERPEDQSAQRILELTLRYYGCKLMVDRQRLSHSTGVLLESLDIAETLLAPHPGDAFARHQCGIEAYNVGVSYYNNHDLERALDYLERSLDLRASLVAEKPNPIRNRFVKESANMAVRCAFDVNRVEHAALNRRRCAELFASDAETCIGAAATLARCAVASQTEKPSASASTGAQSAARSATAYADEAMAWIVRAKENGFTDVGALEDQRFAVLQERADFVELKRVLRAEQAAANEDGEPKD